MAPLGRSTDSEPRKLSLRALQGPKSYRPHFAVLVIAIAAAGLSVPALAVVALVAMVLTLGLLAYHLRHLARHSAARWRGASEQLKGQRQP